MHSFRRIRKGGEGKCLVIRHRERNRERGIKRSSPAAAVWGARAMLPAASMNWIVSSLWGMGWRKGSRREEKRARERLRIGYRGWENKRAVRYLWEQSCGVEKKKSESMGWEEGLSIIDVLLFHCRAEKLDLSLLHTHTNTHFPMHAQPWHGCLWRCERV